MDLNRHNWVMIALVSFTTTIYLTMVGFNFFPFMGNNSLIPYDIKNYSDTFRTDITPDDWIFPIIWSVIYVWQFAWLVYVFVSLFRKTRDGCLFYRKFPFLNYPMFIWFILNNILIIVWIFMAGNKFLHWSFMFISLSTKTMVASFIASLISFQKVEESLIRNNLMVDVWFNRILIHNGLAMFASWLLMATCVSLSSILTYAWHVEMATASSIALIVIAILVTVYFILDNLIYPKHTLYVFTPWIVFVSACVAILTKNYEKQQPTHNNLIEIVLFVIFLAYFAIKLVMFALYQTKCRHRIRVGDEEQFHFIGDVNEVDEN